MQSLNPHDIAAHCELLGVAMVKMAAFETSKFQRTFSMKYTHDTWKMVLVLSSIIHVIHGTSRILCRPNDVVYSCNISKNS